jgi:hypothetical protein
MCQPTPCRTCGKTTWKGCGDHIDAVQAHVPADQWCPGHTDEPAPARKGWFGRG